MIIWVLSESSCLTVEGNTYSDAHCSNPNNKSSATRKTLIINDAWNQTYAILIGLWAKVPCTVI